MTQRNVNVVNRMNINGAESGILTNTELRASPIPVSGPLTDTQIRASALSVSGPLTDTQLRLTAVPVSGPATDAEIRATAIPVSGPLTDTQLRAAAISVSQLRGRYSGITDLQNVYSVCNQAGVTHSAGLTTTFVGLCVGNPELSTVNLHILGFSWTNEVDLAAVASVGIMTGAGEITGVLTPRNRYVGGAAGQGLATGGETLPGTPVLEQVFATVGSTLAITAWPPTAGTFIDLGGSLILPPNTFVASYMSTASGASGFRGSFIWEEVPI